MKIQQRGHKLVRQIRQRDIGKYTNKIVAFVVGVPLFVYGNIINNTAWIVGASLFIIAVSALFCLFLRDKPTAAPTPAAAAVGD